LRLAKAGRLPTLGISASYDLRSDEVSLDSGDWEKTYNGYLVLSLPVFDGLKTKSQIAISRSGVRQADVALAAMREAVELEIRSAMLEVAASRERLASQDKNVEMAAEGLKIANDRYVQGVATNLEVMDAQLAFTQAKNYRLQALHDLGLTKARLERAMGVLLTNARTGARR
jgi:outer membrane protein TolC